MVGLGADRGRVDEDLGSLEAVGAGDLGEPLVPAGRQAKPHLFSNCIKFWGSWAGNLMQFEGDQWEGVGVAGPRAEVAVLVVAGGDGDVELAGAREELAGRRDDDGGVEAEAVLALGSLVERGVDVDPGLPRHPRGEGEGAPTGQ